MAKVTIEGLHAELVALRARVAILETERAPTPAAVRDDDGPRVTTLVPVVDMVPHEELRERLNAVLAAHPELAHAPSHGMSAEQYAENFFDDFVLSFRRIGELFRIDHIDEKRSALNWADELTTWASSRGLGAARSVWALPFIAAALAHGDVEVRLGPTASSTYFALSAYSGRSASLARALAPRAA